MELCSFRASSFSTFNRGHHPYSEGSHHVGRVHILVITFRVSRRRREMYCGHAYVCNVSVYLSVCPQSHAYTIARRVVDPLVVHYLAYLQSVCELRCYGNITRTRNVSECMLVLAICLVVVASGRYRPTCMTV